MSLISDKLAMGLNHHHMGNFAAAQSAYQEVIHEDSRNSQALYYLGVLASQSGNKLAAVELIGAAVEIDPSKGIYYYNLGEALQVLGRLDEAVVAYQVALQRDPLDVEAWNNLGRAQQTLGDWGEAVACFRRALEIRSNNVESLNNLGGSLQAKGDIKEAIEFYKAAIELQPGYVEVHCNLGSALKAYGQAEAARNCYVQALRIRPLCIDALSGLIVQQQELCSWQDHDALSHQVIQLLEEARQQGVQHRVTPLSYLSLPTSTTPSQQLDFARNFFENRFGNKALFNFNARRGSQSEAMNRIRIGYLSGDLQTHPVGLSICELLENHDRERFEIIAYSFGRDDGGSTRQRIVRACDRFVELGQEAYGDSAKRIHHDEINILIDLMGYTHNARTEILATRPAPIQIQFLGFPGTMGAPCIDYMIADSFVVPIDQSENYTEQIIRLPGCFFPRVSPRSVSALATRSDYGLPENAVVFCSFNNSNKITPTMFGTWMRMLREVPNSVLWLYVQNDTAAFHLREEAVSYGVDSKRLVFARRLPDLDVHLARYRLADLFLDTFPYNAHSTAADSLSMGCPVLTLAGQSFASRVAGSLLSDVGCDELVTTTWKEYESRGIELACNARELARLRTNLLADHSNHLFCRSQQYARGIEKAFSEAWTRYLEGKQPAPILI